MSTTTLKSNPFVGLANHLSYSQVALFDKCNLAWFLKYVRGIAKPPTLPMLAGSCYHQALAHNFHQKCHTGIDLETQEITDFYLGALGESVKSGNVDLSDNVDLFKEPVVQVLKSYYETFVVGKMEPVMVEKEFSKDIPHCERKFVGIVDAVLEDGRIIDFKLSSRKWSSKDISEHQQSTAYRFLLGFDVNFEFHIALRNKVNHIQVVPASRSAADVESYLKHLIDASVKMSRLEEGLDEPSFYTGFCSRKICQYYDECRLWKEGLL